MTEPEASVPAVMRNYHEVLRNDLTHVLTPLALAGDVTGFAAAWQAYRDAIAVHAAMEDGVEGAGGGSAAMLDHHFNGAAGAAMFRSEHEEDIMMPLVARLPNPKAPLFAHWCLSAGIAHGGFDHFVSHGVASLATYGSARNTPAGATRVFVHALKTLCTRAQWAHYLPLVRRAMPDDVWAAVIAEVPSLQVTTESAA